MSARFVAEEGRTGMWIRLHPLPNGLYCKRFEAGFREILIEMLLVGLGSLEEIGSSSDEWRTVLVRRRSIQE